ncbi:MAG: acyl-CoA dehydrogenase family protein, partial [Gammaproteobacteria bacterium]
MTVPNLAACGFDADYQAVYDLAYRYARAELYPLCERMDNEDWFPEEAFRALAAQGLLGVTVPTAYGGAGMDVLAQCFIAEAVAYWNHAIAAGMLASDNLCLHNLVRNANEAQRREYLPRFCDGSLIGALGMTEPGAGSDAL